MDRQEALETVSASFIDSDLAVADIHDRYWNRAAAINLKLYWNGKVAPETRHSEARLLWSRQALHVRFVCHQNEPLVASDKPELEKKTMGLWDRDVCEIFIAPDPNVVERYFEFEAAPTGEWMDVAIHWTPQKRKPDWNFNSHMTTAAQAEEDRVIIAMRIPWNKLIPQPKKGERWRVNLFRCVGRNPNRGYLAWQPTKTPEPSFHVPRVFGWLLFT